jgi:Icc-related predicted phosphoesterase
MPKNLRIAALADLHFGRTSTGSLQGLLASIGERADVLLIAGDLTHYGLPEEATALAKELNSVRIPIAAVLGNHDHHSGQAAEILRILTDAGIRVLDGESFDLGGVGVAGTKGFAGGFGQRVLEAWGEETVKAFVREAVEETLKLESALARIQRVPRVALLHYSPILETVIGEPPEIHPFLGSSRLEEPINRYQVVAVFHGHAHHGRLEGRTAAGVPVYNVSVPLMRLHHPDAAPFRLIEIPLESQPTSV